MPFFKKRPPIVAAAEYGSVFLHLLSPFQKSIRAFQTGVAHVYSGWKTGKAKQIVVES